MARFSLGIDGDLITINRMTTPLGQIVIGVTNNGLCLLEFTDRKILETQFNRLKKRLNANMMTGEHPMITKVQDQLEEYFAGMRKDFDLPLVVSGSDFQLKVWNALVEVPYGATRSYKQQSNVVGDVKAVRAVAKANGENRISIVIPCHRIIGSDGSVVGYGGEFIENNGY